MSSLRRILPALMAVSALQACQNETASEPTPPAVIGADTESDIQTSSVSVKESWVLDGFDAPESVLPDADGTRLFVSNVNGDGVAKDGNGYIATISPDGKMLNPSWVDGLDAPKGLALAEGRLYVSDIDRLIIIDTATATVTDTVTIEGAGFLNDVAVTPAGVLLSDSANARIYRYVNNSVDIWLEDPSLSGVNGLTAISDNLLVTTMTEGSLFAVDWDTKAMTKLASDMKNADGIATLGDKGYLVSSWPGKLYHVSPEGQTETLINTEDAPIYWNDFYLADDALYVPNWQPGTVRRYTVK